MSKSLRAPILVAPPVRGEVEFALAQQMATVAGRWKARFGERVRRFDQSDGRWKALYALAGSPSGLIQNELAKRVGVQGPTLVKLLDGLEAQGLVSRRSVPGDRRAKVVVLEPEGRRILSELDRVASEMAGEIFGELSEQDLHAFRKALDQIASRLSVA